MGIKIKFNVEFDYEVSKIDNGTGYHIIILKIEGYLKVHKEDNFKSKLKHGFKEV